MKSFPFYLQSNVKDCGPTCLRMIAEYYGKKFDFSKMANISKINHKGSSLLDIMNAAKKIGIESKGLAVDITILKSLNLPVILHWDTDHFVILFKIKKDIYFIADPAIGILRLGISDFLGHWVNPGNNERMGVVLALYP